MSTHGLHVGINDYRGSQHDLAGCVNDALDCARLFGRRRKGLHRDVIDACPFFGECDSQVVLVDRAATRSRILAELESLLAKLRRGDWGIVTFSGHGTYVKDAGGDEADGYDEALVTADLDAILDDELGVILEKREPGSKLLVVTDSCHSGTATRSIGPRLAGPPESRARFLPPGRIPSERLAGLRVPRMKRPSRLVDVIHFGACRDDQFAADAEFGGRPRGAFTHYWLDAILSLRPKATFADWEAELAKRLPNRHYDQAPQVNAYKRALDWRIPMMTKT